MNTLLAWLVLSGVAVAAPKLSCTAPTKAQRKTVQALLEEHSDDPFYAYAKKAGGEPVKCAGRAGKERFDAKIVLTWKDGSTLTFVLEPPEGGTRLYRSTRPIADIAGVMALLVKEVEGVDWKKHDDDRTLDVVTETYFVPDTNTRAMLLKRGKDVVGFGDGFAE